MARAEIGVWCAAKLVGLGAGLIRLAERDGYGRRLSGERRIAGRTGG
jgi:hypothetical protein